MGAGRWNSLECGQAQLYRSESPDGSYAMRNALAVLALCLVFGIGCWRQAGPGGGAATTTQVWEREAFKKAVEGKTASEVEAVVGKPNKTSDTNGAVRWDYHKRTRDPATGNIDASADVFFDQDGRVRSVSF